MQTKEQIKNWKVVASVATVAALGVSGLAIAGPSDAGTPPPIEIEDQRTNAGTSSTPTTLGQLEVVPGPAFTPGVDSLDSPLASADLDSPVAESPSVDSPTPTTLAPAPAAGDSASVDSPSDDSPAPAPAPAPPPPGDDSPSVDSPTADSPASADSGDSLDS